MVEEALTSKYLHSTSAANVESTLAMVRSIAAAPQGTPFAADYRWRFLPEQIHVLREHGVGFHQR